VTIDRWDMTGAIRQMWSEAEGEEKKARAELRNEEWQRACKRQNGEMFRRGWQADLL